MKPSIALFLELGGSLEEWSDVGFLHREILPYNRLAESYYDTVFIFTYGDKSDLKYSSCLRGNIQIIPRGKKSKNYIGHFLYELCLPFRHRKILSQCQILKTNQNSGSIAAAIAKILFPKSALVVRSGYIGSELARRSHLSMLIKCYYFIAENLSYRLCDIALISASKNRDLLISKYPFIKNKISTLNNYIDTEKFKKDPSIEKLHDIIYVARFDPDKNHQAILDIANDTQLKILLIGKGPSRDEIIRQAQNSPSKITFIESIPNDQLPQYYNSAKLCAFPSLHEGSPKALLEAMACELPIAALDSPGINNIIENKRNGLIGTSTSLRTSIVSLLSDSTLRDTLGKSARETIIEQYSLESILEQEKSIYDKKIVNNL